jgi:seryl-tRNA synthetase
LDQSRKIQAIVVKEISKKYLAKERDLSSDLAPVELLQDFLSITPIVCAKLNFNQLNDLRVKLGDLVISTEREEADLLQSRDDSLKLIGNLVHEHSPISANSIHAKVVSLKSVEDLGDGKPWDVSFGDFDSERGFKVTNNVTSYFLKGNLLILQRGLIHYALSFSNSKQYVPMLIPLVTKSRKRDNLSNLIPIQGYNQDLIRSSLYSILTMYEDERFDDVDLPKKMCTHFTSFTGSSNGVISQYQSIEHIILTSPKPNEKTNVLHSEEFFASQVKIMEEFYQSLGFSYQVTSHVTGSLEKSVIKTFDFKILSNSTNEYVSVGEISNHTDFLSREYDIRFGKNSMNNKGVRTQYVHVISCKFITDIQVLFTMVTNFTIDDKFHLPRVLAPYIQ